MNSEFQLPNADSRFKHNFLPSTQYEKVPFFISLLIGVFFISPAVKAQKTPQELGAFTFYCFKKDSLENLFKQIPTLEEAASFGESIGIAKGSPEFIVFAEDFPKVVAAFKNTCMEMRADTLENKLNWENATLTKVDTLIKQFPIDNSNPGSRIISLTIIKIHFTSNGNNYTLTNKDANKYGDNWKLGNNIKLTKDYQIKFNINVRMFKKKFVLILVAATFCIGLLLLYRASLGPAGMTIIKGRVIDKKIVRSSTSCGTQLYSLAFQIEGMEERLGVFLGTKKEAVKDSTIYLIDIAKTYTFYLDPTIASSNELNDEVRRIDLDGKTIFIASNTFNLYAGIGISLIAIVAAIVVYKFNKKKSINE